MTHASTSVPVTADRAVLNPPRWALLGVLFGAAVFGGGMLTARLMSPAIGDR